MLNCRKQQSPSSSDCVRSTRNADDGSLCL